MRTIVSALLRTATVVVVLLTPIRAPAAERALSSPVLQSRGFRPLVTAQPSVLPVEAPPFAVVSVLDSVLLNTSGVTYGDTDRDGLEELIAAKYSWTTYRWELWVFEEHGNNTYARTHLTAIGDQFTPYLTGDLDGDGRMEIAGEYGNVIRVYESPTLDTYPTVLVWQSPPQTNVLGNLSRGDTDRDGRQELIHSYNLFAGTGRLKIFENTGDNSFAEVLSTPIGTGNAWSAGKTICDLDGDGWDEIAMSSDRGIVLIYEATGDNAWSLVWSDTTELLGTQRSAGGWDLDGNGKPELYITGNDFSDSAHITWDTRVYEAVANNQYALRTTLKIPFQAGGASPAILGDFDGDGDGEYLTWAWNMYLFDAEVGGVWSSIGSFLADADPYCHDFNKNGRWELVLAGQIHTPILEGGFPTDSAVSHPAVTSLAVSPNPFRAETRIAWSPSLRAAHRLAVYDVGGRLIEQRRVAGNPFVWSPRTLPSGLYFVQVEDASGRPIARGRAIARR